MQKGKKKGNADIGFQASVRKQDKDARHSLTDHEHELLDDMLVSLLDPQRAVHHLHSRAAFQEPGAKLCQSPPFAAPPSPRHVPDTSRPRTFLPYARSPDPFLLFFCVIVLFFGRCLLLLAGLDQPRWPWSEGAIPEHGSQAAQGHSRKL